MKMHTIILASIATLATAIPLTPSDSNKRPVKRGLFENISNFPFLASSGSSSSSSSSSSKDHKDEHKDDDAYDFDHDSQPDFHSVSQPDFHSVSQPDFHSLSHTSHVIHHPDSYPIKGHQDHFSHNFDHVGENDVALSYQNQHFGYDDIAVSYQNQYLYDNHISSHDDDHSNNYNGVHDSLLDNSHLDAPEYSQHGYNIDYKNYGGDLGQYSQHAGLLDISNDHNIDHLLDPYSPSHSSYDSY